LRRFLHANRNPLRSKPLKPAGLMREASKEKLSKMTQQRYSADFVTGFATGWPQDKPDLIILSLTTVNGRKDYALTKEHAELIAKTLKATAKNTKPIKV
jgi:hypothetical protein